MARRATLLGLVLVLLGAMDVQAVTAQTIAVIGGDEGCQRFAQAWQDDLEHSLGVRLTDDEVAVLSGCAKSADGEWIWPEDATDPRLPQPVLSAAERVRVAPLAAALQAQLAGFTKTLKAMRDPYGTYPSLWDALQASYLPCCWVRVEDGGLSGWLKPMYLNYILQQTYEQALVHWLQDPNHVVMADYVRWWAQRREAAFPLTLSQIVNPMVLPGVKQDLRIDVAPYPWELNSFYIEALFEQWAIAAGRV